MALDTLHRLVPFLDRHQNNKDFFTSQALKMAQDQDQDQEAARVPAKQGPPATTQTQTITTISTQDVHPEANQQLAPPRIMVKSSSSGSVRILSPIIETAEPPLPNPISADVNGSDADDERESQAGDDGEDASDTNSNTSSNTRQWSFVTFYDHWNSSSDTLVNSADSESESEDDSDGSASDDEESGGTPWV